MALLSTGCGRPSVCVDGTTGATPRLPDTADASQWPEQPPEEDADAWPELDPGSEATDSFIAAGAGGSRPYIEAYTDKKSYLPGETIRFHVSTNAESYSVEILREGWTRTRVGEVTGIAGEYYPLPPYEERPWVEGAKWPASHYWTVPRKWENGSYLAMFRTEGNESAYTYHPFIVRSLAPGSHSRIAFVMNFNTRQAYNWWGKKSLYVSLFSHDKQHATAVSFLRPFRDSSGRGKHYWSQWELSSQLIADGFDPEFITEYDICADPTIVLSYDVLVFSGHHEYISRNTYDALERHHRRGGHMAFFSANDIHWQVRFEDGGSRMVGYRDYAATSDPQMNLDNSLVTTLWAQAPVNRPAEPLQGVSYEPYSFCFEREHYIVQDANHFVFEGTDLRSGDNAGWLAASGETDFLGPYSPASMDVVLAARRARIRESYKKAHIPVACVCAAAVYYEDSPEYGFPQGRGGQVFSAGTHHGWGDSLLSSRPGYQTMRRITRNIIQHMVDSPPPGAGSRELSTLATHWLGECVSPNWCDDSDVDMNGTVDLADFAYLAEHWAGK